jgi:hypothetical protein
MPNDQMQLKGIVCWLWVAILLAGCASAHVPEQNAEKEKQVVLYKRGDGGEAIRCWLLLTPVICASTDDLSSSLFFDCSDEQFECVFDTVNAMAVPRAGLVSGQKYSIFGSNLAVERCFGDRGSCDMALISSRCADESGCTCRRAGLNSKTLFYFSKDRGITSYYTTSDDPSELSAKGIDPSLLADSIPLVTYFLVAERGFFRTPLALEKSSSRDRPRRPDCRN